MVGLRVVTLMLDFYVLYLFCKGALFFMIVKAERLKIESHEWSSCDTFLSLWALTMILVYTLTLIMRAEYAP